MNAVVKNRGAGSGLSCPQEGPGTTSWVSGSLTGGDKYTGIPSWGISGAAGTLDFL